MNTSGILLEKRNKFLGKSKAKHFLFSTEGIIKYYVNLELFTNILLREPLTLMCVPSCGANKYGFFNISLLQTYPRKSYYIQLKA